MHAASAISDNDFEDIVDNLKEDGKISKEQQRQWKKDFNAARATQVSFIMEEKVKQMEEKMKQMEYQMNKQEESKLPQKSRGSIIMENVFEDAHWNIKQEYKILMVGGTGQGKTAFLNFLANAQKVMNSLDGIKSCNEIHDQTSERNTEVKMASKTCDAKKYQFAIGHGKFTLIDTPGQVDT